VRIAHLSDLHVLGDDSVSPLRYLNKRLTGWANLKFRRHAVHKRDVVKALARELREHRIDHVVVTGDLSNLALEGELDAARRLLEDDLHLDPHHVSVVPGNHDVYTSGSARRKRFARTFAPFLTSDLDVATAHASGPFPYVRFRENVAIIGLSSAVPRLPFFASGSLGGEQLEALSRLLEHEEVRKRTPVVLLHHPPYNPPKLMRAVTNGLYDAHHLRAVLGKAKNALVLHGHLHQRMLVEREGTFTSAGATSSSLVSDDAHRMAGFNVYEVDGSGRVSSSEAHVLDLDTARFEVRALPVVQP
jgi:3',5'-cyclic AMP phosphodiesterase CpdA